MGLSLSFGSDDTDTSFDEELESLTESLTTSTQDQTQTESGASSTVGSETGTVSSESAISSLVNSLQQQEVSNLDAGTQQLLQTLLQVSGDPESTKRLTDAFTGKALTAEEDLNAANADILNAARQQSDRDVGIAKTSLARGAGSRMNSVVEQLGLQASADAEVGLRGLEAQLLRENKQVGLDALSSGITQSSGVVAQLAEVLKGATQTSTTTGSEAAQQTELATQLSELLSSSDTETLNQLVALLEGSQATTENVSQTASGTGSSDTRSLGAGFSG